MTNKVGSVNVGARGRGRPKGSRNKTTKAIKQMVAEALELAGGTKYLVAQSKANPTAFLTLVGKIVPLQVAGDSDNPVIHEIRRVSVRP